MTAFKLCCVSSLSHLYTLIHIILKYFFKKQVKKTDISHKIIVPAHPCQEVLLNLLWTCCTISNISTQISSNNKVKLNNKKGEKKHVGKKPGESQKCGSTLSTQHPVSFSCCVRLQWAEDTIRRHSWWSSHQVLIHSQIFAPEATYLKWKSQRSHFPTAG